MNIPGDTAAFAFELLLTIEFPNQCGGASLGHVPDGKPCAEEKHDESREAYRVAFPPERRNDYLEDGR
jgi:hypothetical protein